MTKTPAAADASPKDKAGPSSPVAENTEPMDADAPAPAEVLPACLWLQMPRCCVVTLLCSL